MKDLEIYNEKIIHFFTVLLKNDLSDHSKFIRNFIDSLKDRELTEKESHFRGKIISEF